MLQIIKDPDQSLRRKSSTVEKFDAEFKDFMLALLQVMYDEDGAGIAAIQVGNPIRALIVDIPKKEIKSDEEVIVHREPVFIINPKITYLSEETVNLPEACLSVRGDDGVSFIRADVMRPKSIVISYNGLEGQELELSIDGNKSEYDLWFARCLQHEMDHLDGILFTDKLV